MLHPSLAARVDAIHAVMSREALHLRFTAAAVTFMQRCVAFILRERINDMATIDSPLLSRFRNIRIFDSTSWDIRPNLRNVLPGLGGAASLANCKVQLCYEYRHGALSFFDIVPGKNQDKGYAAKLPEQIVMSQLHHFMAGGTLMVTNVPPEWLPPEMVRPLCMLRWQIELLFKQLKSVLAIHKSLTGKEHRFRCELLGKLIVAILIHKIHADINIRFWNTKRQEISMDKLYKRIQERAFIIMELLLSSLQKAIEFFTSELIRLLKNCRKLKQKSRLSSLQTFDGKISSQSVKDMASCDLT